MTSVACFNPLARRLPSRASSTGLPLPKYTRTYAYTLLPFFCKLKSVSYRKYIFVPNTSTGSVLYRDISKEPSKCWYEKQIIEHLYTHITARTPPPSQAIDTTCVQANFPLLYSSSRWVSACKYASTCYVFTTSLYLLLVKEEPSQYIRKTMFQS